MPRAGMEYEPPAIESESTSAGVQRGSTSATSSFAGVNEYPEMLPHVTAAVAAVAPASSMRQRPVPCWNVPDDAATSMPSTS